MARKPIKKKALTIGKAMAEAAIKRRRAAARGRSRALQKSRTLVTRTIVTTTGRGAARPVKTTSVSAGVLVAEGDSWFDYPFHDVLSNLEDIYGYDVESVAHRGDTVEGMAYTGQLDAFSRRIDKVLKSGVTPRAILLSGGGNDIAGDHFEMLLNHAMSATPGLNGPVVDGMLDRIHDAYVTILQAITSICQSQVGHPVRILVHGYDYAVPDGRGFWGGWWLLPGPWLRPGFRQKGYDMAASRPIVVRLIDRFNAMLSGLAGNAPFEHVKYVNLRRTLSTGSDYKAWWDNELHPTKDGFEAVAAKFSAAL